MLVLPHGANLRGLHRSEPAARTLYVGVTNDLVRRIHEHREGCVEGFTRKHGCKHLVWFETVEDIADAIAHEKRLKKWLRAWKDDLIEKTNPDWRDLWWDIIGPQPPLSPTPNVIPALSRDGQWIGEM